MLRGRPNDRRGFVHKRVIGAVGGLLTGGPIGAAAGFVSGGGGGTAPVSATQNLTIPGTGITLPGFPGTGLPCPPGFAPSGAGCGPVSGATALAPGTAVATTTMGNGSVPMFEAITRRVCERGMVLGSDGLCYRKGSISNKQREWPRGRRPLLTGGEMRAIGIAAAAAKKLQRSQKRLQAMGMLPKPRRSSTRRLAPGHHTHTAHD